MIFEWLFFNMDVKYNEVSPQAKKKPDNSYWTKEFLFIFFMTLRIYTNEISQSNQSFWFFEVYIIYTFQQFFFSFFSYILHLHTSRRYIQSILSGFSFSFFYIIMRRRCQCFIPPVKLVVCITASTQQGFFSSIFFQLI